MKDDKDTFTFNNDLKAKIVETARELFGRFGFKKTTMEDIARAVRKAKSSLYYYFKSKEEVFEAILEKESEIIRRELDEAIASKDDPREKLKAYIIARMHVFKRMVNFYSALKDEYLENYSFIERIRQKYDEEEKQTIKQILEYGNDRGVFDVKEVDLTAGAVIKAIKAFEFPWAQESDEQKIEKEIGMLLDVLFYGIVRR